MKSLYAIFAAIVSALLIAAAPAPLPPDPQQVDNNVRFIHVLRAIDGDTVVADIHLGVNVWLKSKSIRLKDVHCFELSSDQGQASKLVIDKLIAGKLIFAVQIFGTDKYDRILGVVWADGVNINSIMAKEPQGGR
jgi:endonuclease YncB( thermonuclease family)